MVYFMDTGSEMPFLNLLLRYLKTDNGNANAATVISNQL